jgi:UDP-N-acetylglucosamine--dolichyl-phosphate N-acetylglucosaminephosphotransferase
MDVEIVTLLTSAVISFLTTFILTPRIIEFFHAAQIVAVDLHKSDKPKRPSSGGICVGAGILAGTFSYVGITTFSFAVSSLSGQISSVLLLAVISSILIATLSGLLDDLNVRTRAVPTKDGMNVKIGFPQWVKPLLTLPAAVPLMVIRAGTTTMALPIIGDLDFGLLYPLVIIPVGFVAVSNMVNNLGGFNGLEAGMGVVYTFSLGLYALLYALKTGATGGMQAAVLLFTACAALLAFLRFNWCPARILAGDSLTYLLGSLVAAGVIVGDMQRAGLIVMFPFIVEFFLKARSKFKASSLGKLRDDGRLDAPYGKKIYSWTHLCMNLGKLTEREVTVVMIFVQVLFAAIPFLGI